MRRCWGKRCEDVVSLFQLGERHVERGDGALLVERAQHAGVCLGELGGVDQVAKDLAVAQEGEDVFVVVRGGLLQTVGHAVVGGDGAHPVRQLQVATQG